VRRPLSNILDPLADPSGARRGWLLIALGALLLVLGLIGSVGVGLLARGLPEVAALRTLQLQVPLRVFSADGRLIGEFGAERRSLLRFAELPPALVDAFLAVEDAAFYEHTGVDLFGLLRAAAKLLTTGDKAQGGSTITMQLARNVFLTPEKTFTRKFREILLARRIEQELSKDEILELYLNKIFLGERAYGVGAAALTYFGKPVQDLSLSEMAVLAALPKAPSRDNPVANPERAAERRDYVLRRMLELGRIDAAAYEAARAEPIAVRPFRSRTETEAHYAAEMVRAEMYSRFGEETYTRGFTVVTTLNSVHQEAANRALRTALHEYDERQGWRGAESPPLTADQLASAETRAAALAARAQVPGLESAVVLEAGSDRIRFDSTAGEGQIAAANFAWARLSPKRTLQPGDVIRLRQVAGKGGPQWRLAQVPEAQGAFVGLRPRDGAVLALVGGYDFWLSKFNHVTQARRQAGSGFKPFLYSAALAQGYTPASVFLDAPVVFDDPALESSWRPQNYDSDFNGPMRLREALVQSRNLVSVRLLQAIGLDQARNYMSRFGFPPDRLPNDLTIALGSAAFTPLEMARGYAVLANGGFLIEPFLIDEIRDAAGSVLFKALPALACAECEILPAAGAAEALPADGEKPHAPRVIDPDIAWLMTHMLHDVTVRGTAAAVARLGRNDLAGKTGTSNDETDAWFNGYQKDLVGVAWVGFDQPQPLGRGEVGGRAALPIWMDYMKAALADVSQETWPRPAGIVDVRVNPDTGRLAAAGESGIFEVVQADHIPAGSSRLATGGERVRPEDLF
jgi:penicillin-binding protein 1A